jgi:aspartyl protease family protein
MLGSVVKSTLGVAFVALVATQWLVHNLSRERRKPAPPAAAVAPPKPAAPAVSQPSRAGRNEVVIAADPMGQYAATVDIDGARMRMLVDTGASAVVLTYEDAAAAGFYPAPADFKYPVSTANGVGRVALVTLRVVRLGALEVRDVKAAVAERGALGSSLLGMTFLSKLSHFEAGSGRLALKQ